MTKTTPLSTRRSKSTTSSGMPPQTFSSALMREVKWFVLAGFAVYLAISLLTYHASDPSWSHATDASVVLNRGGIVGAWLSDLILYVMGGSVIWLLVFVVQRVLLGYRRLMDWRILSQDDVQPRLHLEKVLGFFALLFGSVVLEALQFSIFATHLPAGAGGILGQTLGKFLTSSMGFDGAVLLCLIVFMIGSSLFFGFSWLNVSEKIGATLESMVFGVRNAWLAREDRKLGIEALQKRSVEVEAKQEKREHHEPVRIEPSVASVPKAPIATKAQQQNLFVEQQGVDLPALSLLDPPASDQVTIPAETLEYTSRLIEKKLADFGVTVTVMAAQAGPVITRYEIEPALGVKGSQIVNLGKDLARALSLVSIRIVETIPGKNLMGLELPNPRRQVVRLSEILGSQVYHKSASTLTMALGKDIAGNPVVADLAKMPHLLVAGTTGSGKSVGINAMILSLLYKATAQEVRLILIDPKMLEMSVYEGIPHLLAPVVTDMRHAANALNWCVGEMEKRYRLMSHMGVRNVAGFNAKIIEAHRKETPIPNPFSLTPESPEPLTTLPMIVVVIDELADLMMVVGKKVEELIARLAQKARAAGIHLILATQRPSVDVITGLIKANIPTRIAFQVSSKIDSRTILDQMGAETLLGQGDMLYMPPGTALPNRVHGAFVSDDEVHRVVERLKETGEPNYIEGLLEGGADVEYGEGSGAVTGMFDTEADPLYDQAVEIVLTSRKASISLVQRQLRIGYNRAARLVEQMEKAGLVSAMQTNGVREILAPKRDME